MKTPLGRVSYAPAVAETKSVSGTTVGDFDATNLVVTFTAPASGEVLLRLQAYAYSGGTAPDQVHGLWTVREGTTNVFDPKRMHRTINKTMHTMSKVVTGLTPDQEYTWKWAGASSNASFATNLEVQTDRPAIMEVFDIEDGDLLANVSYDPAAETTHTLSSTTFADLDATNLAVTFDAPASGEVIVEMEGYANVRQRWTVRENTTNLFTEGKQTLQDSAMERVTERFRITGLTPASSHTYKWGGARIEAGSGLVYAGADSGAMDMRVWAVDSGELLDYVSTTGSVSGHIVNALVATMEDAGDNFNPGGPMLADLEVTFTVPSTGEVYVFLTSDAHSSAVDTSIGHWGLRDAGVTVATTRRRITQGGINRKRRYCYAMHITGLTPDASETWTWGMEGTGAEHFLMNLADLAPQEMEVWAITEAEDPDPEPEPDVISAKTPTETLLACLNRNAGTSGLEFSGACNALAGTSGLEGVGALNVYAENSRSDWRDLEGVLRQIGVLT